MGKIQERGLEALARRAIKGQGQIDATIFRKINVLMI
jgi:hypothetical protein